MDNVAVGLDIGTTKTCAVIGFMNENNQVEVVGVGVAPSKGLKNGVVVNIDNTAASIVKAIEEAELMAGCEVTDVYAGITGQHIKGENSRGVVAVSNRGRTITPTEIRRVIEAAQAIVVPVDREILHVLSKEFSVDDQTGIKDPIGMNGVRLEAEVHIVTAATNSTQNLLKSIAKSGFQCSDIIFSSLATSEAVLNQDEKELGVVMIDIGGGTTDIIVFFEGGVSYSAVLGIGGIHVTNDISIGLRTPIEAAEMIKKKDGCAVIDIVDASESIEVPSVGGRAPRRIFKQELSQIIEPRMMEIMEMVDRELLKSGRKDVLAAGVVLTGGGCIMDGCIEAAERVFNMPVRIGESKITAGLRDKVKSPIYTNAVGLLMYGLKMREFQKGKSKAGRESSITSIGKRLKRWFEEYL
ncbi:MAG: cell division protein FtsA [Spirochaetes bacterium]|nr:cell division protein FtsA [Spirochaetota bacterium]